MATLGNLIPSINAAGRFEAIAPFDQVVDTSKFYTVEALRTITEMEGLKVDLYDLMFRPIGVLESDYPTIISRARSAGAVVVSLLDRLGAPTYVFSTYFKSFPLTDGVAYEHMCAVVDFGPCPPGMSDTLAQFMAHIKDYALSTIGVDSTVKLGTIPTIGYVSREQAEAYENARRTKITDSDNDQAKIHQQDQEIQKLKTYITHLESKVLNPGP